MSKDDMMGPYSEKVMDHFMEPRNMGDIKDADAVGTVGNPACGDVMRLYIKVDGGKITEAKFKTFGCGAAIATSSMATEMIKDKSLDEASEITNEAVAEALDGLPPNKMHCSVLAQEAIEAAIKNYKEKKKQQVVSESTRYK
jgi:nitrogen fixation NifU-like protein